MRSAGNCSGGSNPSLSGSGVLDFIRVCTLFSRAEFFDCKFIRQADECSAPRIIVACTSNAARPPRSVDPLLLKTPEWTSRQSRLGAALAWHADRPSWDQARYKVYHV